MLLDLSRFRTGEEHLDRRFEPSALVRPDDEFQIASEIEFVADVRKDAQKVRIVGRVVGTLQLDCSRCVEPFAVPVDARFDMLFLPSSENTGDGEREVTDDDLGVSYYQDEVIDLGDVIREQLYLVLPMKPLCRPDCQGLCSICGKNRNRETCACGPNGSIPGSSRSGS